MARSLHWPLQALNFQTPIPAPNRPPEGDFAVAVPPEAHPASAATGAELGASVHAERCAVSELLQIARTVLTLDIAFESGVPDAAPATASMGTDRLKIPVVLRNGEVYGRLCCPNDDRRTAMGSRPGDALRTVAVLVGKEVDRHRRPSA
jgi:hypothetical protein